MMNSSKDRQNFKFGTPVRIKSGIMRKSWEWIGNVEIVSGNMASIAWRVILPGTNGKRPVSLRRLNDLEIVDEGVLTEPLGHPVYA